MEAKLCTCSKPLPMPNGLKCCRCGRDIDAPYEPSTAAGEDAWDNLPDDDASLSCVAAPAPLGGIPIPAEFSECIDMLRRGEVVGAPAQPETSIVDGHEEYVAWCRRNYDKLNGYKRMCAACGVPPYKPEQFKDVRAYMLFMDYALDLKRAAYGPSPLQVAYQRSMYAALLASMKMRSIQMGFDPAAPDGDQTAGICPTIRNWFASQRLNSP